MLVQKMKPQSWLAKLETWLEENVVKERKGKGKGEKREERREGGEGDNLQYIGNL